MGYSLNEEGVLVDDSGAPVQVGDEPIRLEGYQSKEQVSRVIQERLARQTDRIKQLESQANRTPELESMLDSMRAEKAELERQIGQVKEQAQAEAQAQLTKLRKDADEYRQRYETEAQARVRDQVTNTILATAKDQFNDPAIDVVPHLLQAHKREEKKGPDGSATGEFLDYFKLRFKNEKGEDVEDFLPVDRALEVWAQQHPHHVRASNRGGSGPGSYVHTGNIKRSEMSPSQKADFVGKHGIEAFQSLPN